jgi:hypothetical protein
MGSLVKQLFQSQNFAMFRTMVWRSSLWRTRLPWRADRKSDDRCGLLFRQFVVLWKGARCHAHWGASETVGQVAIAVVR